MVDISHKGDSVRTARAQALVRMSFDAARALAEATLPKGDAFVAAQLAGILAAKQTGTLVPLAHTLPLASVDVRFETEARTVGKTGVELEALVAATIAALTIYDMTKAVDKGIAIEGIELLEKTGGKSGRWTRKPRDV
jgi:cyclic pyranopterin phosphate synthase